MEVKHLRWAIDPLRKGIKFRIKVGPTDILHAAEKRLTEKRKGEKERRKE